MANPKSTTVTPILKPDLGPDGAHTASILTHWQPIVAAAGLYDARQELFTIYRLGGFISGDPVVAERVQAKVRAWRYSEDQEYPPTFAYTLQVLNGMTLEERQELRARILEKNPNAVLAV